MQTSLIYLIVPVSQTISLGSILMTRQMAQVQLLNSIFNYFVFQIKIPFFFIVQFTCVILMKIVLLIVVQEDDDQLIRIKMLSCFQSMTFSFKTMVYQVNSNILHNIHYIINIFQSCFMLQ